MADWFDQNAPPQQDWFSTNAPSSTPTAVADTGEGDGFLAKINAVLDRAREAQPDWLKYEPEWLKAPQEAGRELLGGMIPHSPREYLSQIYPPLAAFEQGQQLAQGDVSSIPFVGRVPEIMQAEETPAFSKERYLAAMKTLMDVGLLAGAGGERAPSPLRTEPLAMPELPPSPTLGPGTIAQDVSRALERRFTLQEPPPPEIAPSVPIEQTLPKTQIPEEPPVFNPELGPSTRPDFEMPLRTETMQLSPAERNGQILERRKGILARKAELTARAAGGEQGLEGHLAAVEAELNDPVTNPVVHAPPVEVPVRHGEFAKPGYTAVETPPEGPVQAPVATTPPEPYTPEAAAARAAQPATLPTKPSKIGQSIEAKAVEAKLTKGFPETAGYNPITIKDQAARASSVVESSPEHARAIVRGEAPLPPELRGTSLITAMEEHLLRNPDAQVAYELANSRLVSLTSEAAQEMRLMSERVPDSITSKFAEIKAAREAGAKLRGETPAKVKADITKEVVKTASKRPTWEAFVREIVC